MNISGEQLSSHPQQFGPSMASPAVTQQQQPRLVTPDYQRNITSPTGYQSDVSWSYQNNMYAGMMYGSGLPDQSLYSTANQQHQFQPQMEDVFDEAAFESAFEAARSEMQDRGQQSQHENLELGQDVLINESAGRLLQSDHLVEQELIGADTIPHEAQEGSQEPLGLDDPDELARTAGQLLDSVKYEQNQKFRDSNFLALMRRLRDREVRVEGDKMVDVSGTSPSMAPQHHHCPPPELITCRVFECEINKS